MALLYFTERGVVLSRDIPHRHAYQETFRTIKWGNKTGYVTNTYITSPCWMVVVLVYFIVLRISGLIDSSLGQPAYYGHDTVGLHDPSTTTHVSRLVFSSVCPPPSAPLPIQLSSYFSTSTPWPRHILWRDSSRRYTRFLARFDSHKMTIVLDAVPRSRLSVSLPLLPMLTISFTEIYFE
jgi:hypothetical protein